MDAICQQDQHTSVLLVTLAAQGHLNPIVRLGNRLLSKGLHVTLATNDISRRYLPPGATALGGISLQFFSDGLPIDYNREANLDHYLDMQGKFGPLDLLTIIRSSKRKFACIINTPFVPWAADVAAEVGIPSAMLWIQPCTLYQIYYQYYNRLQDFPTQSNPNMSVNLPGLPVLGAEELPSFILPSYATRSFGKVLDQLFRSMHKVKWVLGTSFMELEKDVILWLNDADAGRVFWPVGPVVPATLFGEEEDVGFDLIKPNCETNCMEWLDKQNPSSVVYISFGTLLRLSQTEIQNIAVGLKNTKRPFLWVMKSSELGFLEEMKGQGLVVGWSPQSAVLSHRSVGCFLSHCGWNSLLESITAGVPVVACPQWSDQPTNAKLVSDVWGVGVKLRKNSEGVVGGDEVERCVEEVMTSTEVRRKVAELKKAAREAVADGGSSDKNIQMFVNQIISSSSSSSCN